MGQKLKAAGKALNTILAQIFPPMVARNELADAIGYIENAGAPSSVAGDFIGQWLFDTTNKIFYVAYGVAAGEWTAIGDDTLTLAELQALDGATATNDTTGKVAILGTSGALGVAGAVTAAGLTSTGPVTSTEAVASGTARKMVGLASVGTSAADSVTAAASNNSFIAFAQTYVIPASTVKAGTVIRVKAGVRVSNASGTDTLTVEVRIGGTSLIATTAVDPGATTDLHILEFEFVGRAAAGAAASCVGFGRWITNTGGTIAHGTGLLGATNFATNGALTLDVRAKWSAATASTAALLELLDVEVSG